MSSRSQALVPTATQIERSWHLLSILIRFGRPVHLSEIASRSALDSISLSPDLADFLCRNPGSPLQLTESGFVTISQATVGAFSEFFNQAFVSSVPRVLIRESDQRRRNWGCFRLMYARKRKVRPLDAGLVGPSAKKRLFITSERDVVGVRREDDLGIQYSSIKALEVHANVADMLAKDYLLIGISSNISCQGIALTPFHNGGRYLPSSEVGKDNHVRDNELERVCGNAQGIDLHQELCEDTQAIVVQKELHDNTQAMIVQKELQELSGYDGPFDLNQNPIISEAMSAVMSEPDLGSILLDNAKDKTFWMETLGEDSCITAAAPLALSYEVDSSSFFLGTKNDSNIPSLEIGGLIGHETSQKENVVATGSDDCRNEEASLTNDLRKEPEEFALEVQTDLKFEPLAETLSAEPRVDLKQQRTSLEKLKVINGSATNIGFPSSFWESNTTGNVNDSKQKQTKRNEKAALVKQKMKRTDNKLEATPKVSKSNSEPKLVPDFESFVIEEEEGSGGYGTVYRARRKENGKIFAVKCPHPNAHSHHVNNEMKMLERFGGRNFVIKYEGSFKSGQSECFVLEHVEHDRPEVLKRDIDVFELQWYGYCMFRALASLHKQEIVHRDVKPGNFLFSRKLNKGYLIDFNLASDLHQKFSRSSRSRSTSNANLDPLSLSSIKSTYNQALKIGNDVVLNNTSKEVTNESRKVLSKNPKRSNKGHIDTIPNINSTNKYGSQAADSGVTSAKDPTSTRTSADRLKKLIPYKGRKELINFVHEAMQNPNHKATTSGPSSQRKRVAAPLGKMNSRLMIQSPMPVHSGGHSVAGAGLLNRGNGKQKREGPCVGTKGFRAPEVLFKSYHQGCKVDIWSAGVTLLYLIIGKTPFGGDPEQNIKEISKLRGSEDLWEVAKLHDCESSFPPDLFDVQSLQSMKLRDWCMINTKRPEFLDVIPQSLFDLVDKCLTVNPRRRITAEEALMHKFFAPCHEILRKQRLLRRTIGSESGSASHSQSSY